MRGPLLQESLTHVMCCGIARVETSRCRTAGREQTERQANRVYQAAGGREGLHRVDATVGIRVRTGQIGAIPPGQATCASAIALQKSSRAPFSCSAAEQQRSEQEKGEKKRERPGKRSTRLPLASAREKDMRFERAAKQQAAQFFFVPLVFQRTLQARHGSR